MDDVRPGTTPYARQVCRAERAVPSNLRAMGSWSSYVDGVVAGALSAVVLGLWVTRSSNSALTASAVVCGLMTTTTVAWRNRAPEVAVTVAGAGAIGAEWLASTHRPHAFDLVVVLAVLLGMYTAGARGVNRRQVAALAALVIYGIAVCAVAAIVTSSLSVANVIEYALPIVVVPASVGWLVARHRSLTAQLAAATAQLRAGEEMRLALVSESERNRVARELHDVVAHAVSVMVVQAGAARITLTPEPNLARAALDEVTQAGRAAMAELRRIIGVGFERHSETAPNGIAGIDALVEHRRAGGLVIRMSVTGSERAMPAAVDVTIYRLVQEALTNIAKHARPAEADVSVAIEQGAVAVRVRNSAPKGPARSIDSGGSGQGLVGMRERVQSCGGQLSYGPLHGGGFEVRARIPLTTARDEPSRGRPSSVLTARIRARGPWLAMVAAMCILGADADASPDRGQSLALNIGLAVAMAVPLIWRRRSSLLFLVAVNLLAVPISNSVGSDSDLLLLSTYVFVVPVWAVAAWSTSGPAVTGLVLAGAFNAGECLYWHFGVTAIAANLLFTGLLWGAGRVVRSQRLLAADLERTHSRLAAEQQTRELLRLAAERTRLVAELHSLVDEQVSAMVGAAESTRSIIGADSAACAASIAAIERAGREALARLREILGLLRTEHDPERLSPLFGVEHLHDLVSRYRPSGSPTELDVSGSPVPLLGGLDVLAYRIVEDVLAAAGDMAPSVAVSLRFTEDYLGLEFVVAGSLVDWAPRDTQAKVQRRGGRVRRERVGVREHIIVELPLALALVSQ